MGEGWNSEAHHNPPITWIKWKRAGFYLKCVSFSCCLSKVKPFYRMKSKHTSSPKHSSWNKVDKVTVWSSNFCSFSTATMQINSQLFKSRLLSSMSSLWRTRKANILHNVFIYSRGQLLKGFIRITFNFFFFFLASTFTTADSITDRNSRTSILWDNQESQFWLINC